MKKILIPALILGAIYFAYKSNKTKTLPTNTNPTTSSDVFVKYNGHIVTDAKGYWMIIRDGKLYNIKQNGTVQDWLNANPSNQEVVTAPENIWETYVGTNYGGLL